jgi:hypothetical protein
VFAQSLLQLLVGTVAPETEVDASEDGNAVITHTIHSLWLKIRSNRNNPKTKTHMPTMGDCKDKSWH